MNIIIIDGDSKFLKKFTLDLRRINDELTKETFNIITFLSSKEFLKFEKLKSYDLLIISIENIGEINGIDLAKSIREKGIEIPLIFLAEDAKYSMQLHELRVVNFILKSSEYYFRLKKTLKYIVKKIQNKKLKIVHDYHEYFLEVDNIIYIDSFGSKKLIKYFCTDLFSKNFKVFYHYTSFANIKNKLLSNNFIQIRRSTYVNEKFIFKRYDNIIKMRDVKEFMIGGTFRQEVNNLLSKF